MTSVGETLRRARLQRNLELNRIADELKISAGMLKAIEEERFDKLPGGVFARSFVRQYARLLELNENEIISELKDVLEPTPQAFESGHPVNEPAAEIPLPRMSGWQAIGDRGARWSSSVGALVLMLLVMLACAGAYAWWQRARHPAAAHVIPPAATKPETRPASEPNPQPAPETPADSAPAAEKTEALPQTETANPVPAAAARVTAPAAEADPNAAVRVEVLAQEASWIWMRADGQFSFSGVLEANQAHTVTANRNVILKLGNAGGVDVRLNGKPIGPLGAKGAVRTIQLTPGGFQIVPPEVPSPAPPTESPNPL
ncbi:MAG TPA: RodZ domain-containing protein [Bryobacteraceae bacterium]|nr:RodZ domain-containing protein [Bryobacteraceae bacterium]